MNGITATGFASPAQGYEQKTIDFNAILVKHPAAVFSVHYTGKTLTEYSILPGDILNIDCSVIPAAGRIAVLRGAEGFKCAVLEHSELPDTLCYTDENGNRQYAEHIFGIVTSMVRIL